MDFYSWALLFFSLDEEQDEDVNAVFGAWILLAFIFSTGLHHFGFVSLFFLPFLSNTLESCSFLSALGRFGLVSN